MTEGEGRLWLIATVAQCLQRLECLQRLQRLQRARASPGGLPLLRLPIDLPGGGTAAPWTRPLDRCVCA
eukprot:9817939-Alexandrium_andersonii.AAC.1